MNWPHNTHNNTRESPRYPIFPLILHPILLFCCLVAKSIPTLCNPKDCSMPGFPVLHYLLEFAQTHVHWVGDTIQSSPLLSHLLLPSVIRSIRVFSSESALHISWPKDWSFSFSSSPSNEYLGLLSFKTDWFEILAVQGTLKSLLQHHSSKASVLQSSAFFTVQLSCTPQRWRICLSQLFPGTGTVPSTL